MKITELKKHIENLPDDIKEPILALIEYKTDSDMEKVLDKITGIKQELESKMDTQYRMLLWTVGVGMSFIAILIAFFQLLK